MSEAADVGMPAPVAPIAPHGEHTAEIRGEDEERSASGARVGQPFGGLTPAEAGRRSAIARRAAREKAETETPASRLRAAIAGMSSKDWASLMAQRGPSAARELLEWYEAGEGDATQDEIEAGERAAILADYRARMRAQREGQKGEGDSPIIPGASDADPSDG